MIRHVTKQGPRSTKAINGERKQLSCQHDQNPPPRARAIKIRMNSEFANDHTGMLFSSSHICSAPPYYLRAGT